MTEADLTLLKNSVNKIVSIETLSGESLVVKVLSVFHDDDSPDVFYDLMSGEQSTSSPQALPLSQISAVKAFPAID